MLKKNSQERIAKSLHQKSYLHGGKCNILESKKYLFQFEIEVMKLFEPTKDLNIVTLANEINLLFDQRECTCNSSRRTKRVFLDLIQKEMGGQ